MKARPSSAPQRGRGFSWKGRGGDQVISEEEAVVAADRSDLLEPVKMPANCEHSHPQLIHTVGLKTMFPYRNRNTVVVRKTEVKITV